MRRALLVGLCVLFVGLNGSAQQPAKPTAPAPARITTPKQEFGHNFGDDYFLANYQQLSTYWKKLEKESPRIKLQEMGKTAEGRTQLMAIVTSPENHRRLARYKEIAARLAHARGANGDVLTDAQARALAKEGKTVVWIDGGLHATEVLGAQQLGEMVYQFVSGTDEETTRILNDCIILFVHANPDGNDLTADWYMRNPVPEQRSMTGLPKLYQKYIGHDNNRDFFGSTQAETENMNRVLYHEWFPQILYNHHQSGPAGTILWSPPLRDPFNYNQDPLLVLGIQTVGLALHTRLAAEGKPGATMRSGGPYDGWWNGGLRNTAAFHNVIAILTEMIGNPTPQRVPFMADRQVPSSDLSYPVPPTLGDTLWHFRQSIDYSVATNRGVLDLASRMRENFLFNIYRMGKNSIERGSADTWTPKPHRFAAVVAANAPAGGGRGGGAAADTAMWAALHRPEDRDPRAFVIPSTQRDFLTATKFINALLETGIRVERATRDFTAAGTTYAAGSYVVNANQAFRPHVIDMFEPQDHPDNFAYPGAPPTRPYDNAGWTLAFQMGIEFDRLFDTVKDPGLRVLNAWNVAPPAGAVPAASAGGFLLSRDVLDSFRALNKLAGHEMGQLAAPMTAGGKTFPTGTFWVDAASAATLADLAKTIGISATAVATKPAGLTALKTPRVGLWDMYGGSMDAGWTRWILEQFDFPFERVFAPALDAGNLNAKYDVLVFVGGAIPASGAGRGGRGGGAPAGGGRGAGAGAPLPVPAEYAGQQGAISNDITMPALKQFAERGGTIIAIDSSATNLGAYLGLPMENHLVENGAPLPQQKFYAPGSVLRAHVDTTSPFAFGMQENTDVFYSNAPVWKLGADAAAKGVKPIAWFDSKTPLRSGWAWGQAYLERGVIAIDAKVGEGRALLFGPDILQRAQPHGTFKFLFNGIWVR